MSVDILGTNCDQCLSTVQCCFTSTETVGSIRTESLGRTPRLPQLLNSEVSVAIVSRCKRPGDLGGGGGVRGGGGGMTVMR